MKGLGLCRPWPALGAVFPSKTASSDRFSHLLLKSSALESVFVYGGAIPRFKGIKGQSLQAGEVGGGVKTFTNIHTERNLSYGLLTQTHPNSCPSAGNGATENRGKNWGQCNFLVAPIGRIPPQPRTREAVWGCTARLWGGGVRCIFPLGLPWWNGSGMVSPPFDPRDNPAR